jgi:agmatine deiminase
MLPSPTRRRLLQTAAVAPLAAALAPARASATPGWGAAARIAADFEPAAAIWLGYDPGHEAMTTALAAALQPHVPLKLLLRDAELQAQALQALAGAGVDTTHVPVWLDPQAPYFLRDAAVFARDDAGRLAMVDLKWSHYGWRHWCGLRHGGDRRALAECTVVDDEPSDGVDRRLASALGLPLFSSPLAMEGGGIEVNGRGLLIANEALWLSRHPGRSRAEIEVQILRLPGVRRVIWLPAGLAHDPLHRGTIVGRHVGWGTGGHTDQFVRFADERTVLLAWPDAAEAARHPVARLNLQRMQRNLAVLARSTDLRGRPLRVLKLPLPQVVERRIELSADADSAHSAQWSADSFAPRERRRQGDGVMQVASASYANFVVANDLVLLPDYLPHGTPPALQASVRRVVAEAFAGRAVRFVDAMALNWVGGGPHCATLNEPA